MGMVRDIVLARLKELDWSHYKLVEEAHKRGVGRANVYAFLASDREASVSSMEVLMEVLGLSIVVSGRPSVTASRTPAVLRKKKAR